MKREIRRICLLLAALLTVLTGCARMPGETQTLRACFCAPIATLDPAQVTDSGEQSVVSLLFEGLMRLTDDGEGNAVATEGIAESFTYSENANGTLTYTFSIRSSAFWSDGRHVTAGDFVYAWRRLVDPATNSPNASMLSAVAGYDTVRETGDVSALAVEARNTTTFCVTLTKPSPSFIESVCTAAACAPLREDILTRTPDVGMTELEIAADPEGYEKLLTAARDTWAKNASVVTCGPYSVREWTEDGMLLARNEGYYDAHLARADEITLRFAENADAAYALYNADEVDYAAPLPSAALKKLTDEDGNASYGVAPLAETCCLLYNHLTDAFSDAVVRRAFDLAVDRDAVAETVGMVRAASGLVPYGIRTGTDRKEFREITTVAETTEETVRSPRELLAQSATYDPSEKLTLIYVKTSANAAVASFLTAAWEKSLGTAVTATPLTQEEFDERIEKDNFSMALMTFDTRKNDAAEFLNRFVGDGMQNPSNCYDSVYEILLGVAAGAKDMAAETAFLHDAETLLLKDNAVTPLYYRVRVWVLRPELGGICHDAFGHVCLTGVAPR